MSRQLTLFGKPVSFINIVYKTPKNNYEKFVNTYCNLNECRGLSKQKLKEKADGAWRQVKKLYFFVKKTL